MFWKIHRSKLSFSRRWIAVENSFITTRLSTMFRCWICECFLWCASLQTRILIQVDIQLIEEQPLGNRTVQRLKIFLKNFEIEDSTYICLISSCPIHVQYGSDSILLNVTGTSLSHRFLSMSYLPSHPAVVLCTIQTRFAIVSLQSSLTCTERIYIHPRFDSLISGQVRVDDCRTHQFEQQIYQPSLRFHRTHLPMKSHRITVRPSDQPCQYTIENIHHLDHRFVWKQLDYVLTTVTLLPLFNPWKDESIVLGPCRTALVPFKEMYFTEDIVHVRNVHTEPGRTVTIRCNYSLLFEDNSTSIHSLANNSLSFLFEVLSMAQKYISSMSGTINAINRSIKSRAIERLFWAISLRKYKVTPSHTNEKLIDLSPLVQENICVLEMMAMKS